MKKRVYNEALKLYNDLISQKVYISFKSVLESMYETASQKKRYTKCYILQDLIIEEINS